MYLLGSFKTFTVVIIVKLWNLWRSRWVICPTGPGGSRSHHSSPELRPVFCWNCRSSPCRPTASQKTRRMVVKWSCCVGGDDDDDDDDDDVEAANDTDAGSEKHSARCLQHYFWLSMRQLQVHVFRRPAHTGQIGGHARWSELGPQRHTHLMCEYRVVSLG